MATINRFEDLEIWQNTRILCKEIRRLIMQNRDFAKDFALLYQLTRSSGSIMDNIAEGFGREDNKEFINFPTFAQGSCNETKLQLYRAFENEQSALFGNIEKLGFGIKALINYLINSDYKGTKFKRSSQP